MQRIRDFVTALRSGEYAQTQHMLAKRDPETGATSYCCEGVAFERYHEQLGYGLRWSPIIGCMVSVNPKNANVEDVMIAPRDFWRDMGMLVGDHRTQFRFIMPDGMDVRGNDEYDSVQYSELNDAGFTFNQIADLIEWQFLSGTEVTQ